MTGGRGSKEFPHSRLEAEMGSGKPPVVQCSGALGAADSSAGRVRCSS